MSRVSLILGLSLWLCGALSAVRASDTPARPAGHVPSAVQPLDVDRYMGRWYVIGRVANPVERGHVASFNDYQRVDEDTVRIEYHYRDGLTGAPALLTLRASANPDSGYRRWRTWFYKVVPTRTDVLEVADDYSWALIGYPGREMAWIMARAPEMDTLTYRALMDRLNDHGYNTDRMRRVVHDSSHLGQLGFESPRH